MRFEDRVDAGRQLAEAVAGLVNDTNTLVLGIPRGGVVTGYEVALKLNADFDVMLARKIGAPGNPELAIGAAAEDGLRQINDALVEELQVSADYIDREVQSILHDLERRAILYRGKYIPADARRNTVVIVDDGIATGSTMLVSISSLRRRGARRIVVAAPVISADILRRLKHAADDVASVHVSNYFSSVGSFYENFDQVSDLEVRELLADVIETRKTL